MKGFLIDSNVLLDVFTDDRNWRAWSSSAMEAAAGAGTLSVNPLIYAEVSTQFPEQAVLDDALVKLSLSLRPLPWGAAFLAGRAYVSYRQSGGVKRSPLPDFYIGAHAVVDGLTLITRDVARYRTYFPQIALVTPEQS